MERDTGDWRQLKRAVTLRARKWFSLRLARRLIEVHKNPFFIRDRGDFQCHVRVFVFSRGGRERGREAAVRGRAGGR